MTRSPETRKILITGGAGFIGSNLIPELKTHGDYDIAVIDNESLGRFSDIAGWDVRCIKADIRDDGALTEAMRGVHTVVHLAADTRVMDSIVDPRKNFEVNVVGTFNLLCHARSAGVVNFINASTGGAIMGEVVPPVHEEMVPRPMAPYGASKLAAEGYMSAFAGAYGMKTTSLRFSNIYGPRSYHKGSVVAHFLKQIQKGEDIIVYGDGSQTRDYLFVGDLVKGIHQSIIQGTTGVLQLGSGRPTSVNQLLSDMHAVVGDRVRWNVRYEPFRHGELRETWCEISKARGEIGFNPTTTLKEGLSQTWDWFNESLGVAAKVLEPQLSL